MNKRIRCVGTEGDGEMCGALTEIRSAKNSQFFILGNYL